MSGNNIDNIKQEVNKVVHHSMQVSGGEFIRFIFYSSIFCVIILNQVGIDDTYQISQGISAGVYGIDSWEDMENLDDLKLWITNDMVPLLYEEESSTRDTSDTDSTSEVGYLRINWFNRAITPVRLVQKRMKLIDNPSERFREFHPYVWAESRIDIYQKDAPGEDKESYGVGMIYEYADDIGVKQSGGFQILLQAKTAEEASKFLNFTFEGSNWIDRQTATLFIDVASYNGHFDMTSYIVFAFTVNPSGLLEKFIDITSFRVEQYRTSMDAFRALLEGIYAILTMLYTAIAIIRLKVDYLATRTDFIEKYGALNKSQEFKAFLQGIKLHISNFWNVLDITSLVMSYMGIILWVSFVTNPIYIDESFTNDSETLNTLLEVKQSYLSYTRISSLNLLLIFFRLLKYMGKFERVYLLFQTLKAAKNDILYFFVLLMGIFMAFVIFAHVAFGEIVIQFSTLQNSISYCLLILFGDNNVVMQLLGADSLKTVIFFFSYTFLINFVLINMFIAIISNAYSDNLVELENRKKQEALTRSAPTLHGVFRMRNKLKYLYAKLRSLCSKKLKIAIKYKQETIRLHETESEPVTRIKDFNLNYDDYVHNRESIDSNVMTDNERYIRFKESAHLLSKQIWSILLFLAYLMVTTAVLLSQLDITTKSNLTSSVTTRIYDSSFNEGSNLEDINTFDDLNDWITQAFPTIISFNRYGQVTVQSNFLIGQFLEPSDPTCLDSGAVRITIRRVKTTDNPSNIFSQVEPNIREKIFGPTDYRTSEEDTGDLAISANCTIKYSEDGGLWNRGGYKIYLSSQASSFVEQFEELSKLKIFDNSLNTIVVDFVVFNPDLNYFIYSAISCWFLSGGKIETGVSVMPSKISEYYSDKDKARALFEALYILLLFLHIYITFRTIYSRYNNYNNWFSRFRELLTPSQRRKRELSKPEWLRRISMIIDLYIILDIISYFFAFICLGLWFSIVHSSENFELPLPTEDTDYLDYFAAKSYTSLLYEVYSAIYILIIYFRILQYTRISRSLTFLQDIISHASVNIIYFLIMILTLLMGYVFMGYLALGTTSKNFSTVEEAFITCFSMFIGTFDFEDIILADNILGPIFFFSFMILFLFVLFNIFIAILEHAYENVKKITQTMGEKRPGLIESLASVFFNLKKLFERNSKHKKDNKEYTPDLARFVFQRIETGLVPEEDPEIWGVKQSDMILMERSKRRETYESLHKLFRIRKQKELDGNIFIQIKPEAIDDEMKARLNYWNYLRIGLQEITKHEKQIIRASQRQQVEITKRREELDNRRMAQEDIILKTYSLEHRLNKLREESQRILSMMNEEK
jgi:hypothetical protein